MKINDEVITAKQFAFDGCHKIYILESDAEVADAEATGYQILPIQKLRKTFKDSCDLRFISNWSLTKSIVPQCQTSVIFSDYSCPK